MPYFSIPYNYDVSILDKLFTRFPKRSEFCKEIYFPAPVDIVSSGRSLAEPADYKIHTRQIVSQANQYHVKSNILLNPSCTATEIQKESFLIAVLKYIEELSAIGLASATVSDYYIATTIKKEIPDLQLQCSCIAQVDTVRKAMYWLDIGVNTIVIPAAYNKDFSLLNKLRKAVGPGQLKVLVNQHCLPVCPMSHSHLNAEAHGVSTDSYTKLCQKRYAEAPWLFYSSGYIPPYCMHYYDGLVDVFKITDRANPTEAILTKFGIYTGDDRYYEEICNYNNRIPESVFVDVMNCKKNCFECVSCKESYEYYSSH